MSQSLEEVLDDIRGAIGRGFGTFGVAHSPPGRGKPFTLATGSIRAVQVEGGFVVVLGLRRDQVEKLRAMCDELLGEELS